MYSEQRNYVNFFRGNLAGSDKMLHGRVSESFKVSDDRGGGYEYETWNARFIKAAKEKAEKLKDGTRIVLTKWAAHCPYVKEKNQSFPYILVMDFELASDNPDGGEQGQDPVPNDII